MNTQRYIQIAALAGAFAVGLGAFGAHGLQPLLEANGRQDTFETAVKYHFYHSLAMLAVGILMYKFPTNKLLKLSFWALFVGTLVFSCSLYILSLSSMNWFGAIAPIGGVSLILGWILIVLALNKSV